ncbi:hypothetical protein BSK49_10740 [Paenibacillus odorifer]|uniref:hypothetical protein n=1 Tax=Paenibacillus odorifer TaxID=189426 RepID=UPI00096F2275|nr:hypothetical protein [Paenibacillus odorifer]OMD89837.1 hypothetical protein BSK49_10740 [Paenibacillus odorifer]
MATIKIWGKELVCNCCSQSNWDHSKIRVTICDVSKGEEDSIQSRYLFSCTTCGVEVIFGKIYDWENSSRNIVIEEENSR